MMKTLYLRIVWTTIFVMLVSSFIAFIVSNVYYQQFLKPYNDGKITAMAQNIAAFTNNNPSLNKDNYLNHIGALGYQIYLVNEQGGNDYGGAFRDRNLGADIIRRVQAGETYHGISHFAGNAFVTGFFDNEAVNTIGVPVMINGDRYALFMRPNTEVQFGELRLFFSVLVLLMILISMVLVIMSTRYIVKPIVTLTDATKKIAQGMYDVDLNVKRKDEIGTLTNHFAKMAKSLSQLDEMRQEFVSNVSHEIQSPLASIQGFAQTLRTEKLSDAERERYLTIIEEESQRMSSLSKQLLTLATLDKEDTTLEKKSYDVAAQIKQVILMTEWSWQEKDLAFSLNIASASITADEKLLHQVWVNLITNSIKYTGAGGTISIDVSKTEWMCIVTITDTGQGIAPEDMPFIFDRFYRADKARNRKEGSTGLGLSIVQKIVHLHNGSIKVESETGGGTTFSVSLPILS